MRTVEDPNQTTLDEFFEDKSKKWAKIHHFMTKLLALFYY